MSNRKLLEVTDYLWNMFVRLSKWAMPLSVVIALLSYFIEKIDLIDVLLLFILM